MKDLLNRSQPILKAVFLSLCILSACSGPRTTTVVPTTPDDVVQTVDIADYETFDIEPFRDDPPRRQITVIHDVPEALMQSRADAGVVQEVDGYRVQVFSSLDRNEAVMAELDFTAWWQGLPERTRSEFGADAGLAVYNNFKQPLYRVRVGDFTRRADAERLMSIMASRFATVFVVPDRVTIRR